MRIPKILTPEEQLRRVIFTINGNLDIFDNFSIKSIFISNTGAADSEISLDHALGRIPTFYVWNTNKAGTVYDSARSTWTKVNMKIKCSTANSEVMLVIF